MTIPSIGFLGRTDDTPNAGNQANDHNAFQDRIDAILSALGDAIDGLTLAAPLPTLLEAFAGVTVPADALVRWAFSQNRIVDIVCIGDSTTQEGIMAPDDTFVDRLARFFGSLLGQRMGYGFRSVSYGLTGAQSNHEWEAGRTFLVSPVGVTYTRTVTDWSWTNPGSVATSPSNQFIPTDAGASVSTYGTTNTGVTISAYVSAALVNVAPHVNTGSGTVTVTLSQPSARTGYPASPVNQLAGAFVTADVGSAITVPTDNGGTIHIPPGTTITGVAGGVATLSAPVSIPANTPVHVDSDLAWSITTSTDAFDVAPNSECVYMRASSAPTPATAITWTIPPWMTDPIVGFDIEFPDMAAAANAWQYSTDDCVTWNTVPNVGTSTRTGSNLLKRLRVSAPVAARVQIRSVNGTTPVNTAIAGIVPYTKNPLTASGWMWHNLGRDGFTLTPSSQPTPGLVHSGAGDSLAILDDGTTHPGGLNPALVIGCFTNDVEYVNNTTTWTAGLAAVDARVGSSADVLWWSAFEQSGRSVTDQNNYRIATKAFCEANGWAYVDIYEAWRVMLGAGGYSAANAAGLMSVVGPLKHQSQKGINDIAGRMRRLLLTFS